MASKKTKKATGPDLSNRVLEFGDLSKREQENAVSLQSRISETMPQQMQTVAERHMKSNKPGMVSKGRRYTAAAPKMESKPLTMEGMVAARKTAFTAATSGDIRLPEENVAGEEFYFKHRKELDTTVGRTNIPISRVVDATSRLSIQTKPEKEKEALSALTEAHARGSVQFNEQAVQALRSAKAEVPEEMRGKTIPFKDVPGGVVRAMTDPSIRSTMSSQTTNADLGSMAKTSMRTNLQYAHEALQGTRDVSPTNNPKLFSYGKAHELAVPDSPEHREYQARASHIGKTMRGEIAGSQQMFDFEGLRGSNEGALSNRLQTANDSWMLANQFQQPQDVRKVSGDINLMTKQGTTKRGRKLAVGVGNKDITPAGIQHAVGAEATSRAARELQTEHDLDFTVPAMLVQEGVWAAERRQAGADTEFNARKRVEKVKAPKSQGTQLRLFKD